MNSLRVAFFADSFHEVNGVAHTCRTIASLARRHEVPFFVAYGGPETQFRQSGAITECELKRGSASFSVERDLRYDLLFYRHRTEMERRLREFAPDVVHITGPGDVGTLGLVLAKALGKPICASWHTNLHEYAGRRLEKVTPFLPADLRAGLANAAQGGSMQALGYFYNLADTIMAPNQELLDLVGKYCPKPGFLMRRGVDTDLFTPAKRNRTDTSVRIGYVGRISIEKNIFFLSVIDAYLREAGIENHRFLIAGDGGEREMLEKQLRNADFTGVIRGEELAKAYANMDVFVFPSRTDTFGNVVLEALASGVPAVVTADGGPKFIVKDGESGFVAPDDQEFLQRVRQLVEDRDLRARMGSAARQQALGTSWDAVWNELQTAWSATVDVHDRVAV